MRKFLALFGIVSFSVGTFAAGLSASGGGASAVVDGDKPHVSSSTENIFFTSWGDSTYTLSASPGGGYVFIDSETTVSAGEPNGANSTKKTITDTNADPESFSLGLYGKMYKPGDGEGSPIDWSASIDSRFFYIRSNQNDGAKNIVVPHGVSVLYTAYSGSSTQESTWNVTNFPSKDSDSIRFNKSWWLSLWPWSAPNITDPMPGVYSISATSKDPVGGSDSGEMKVVGVASVSGHGKTSTREETPSGTDKWTDSETIYAQPKSVVELTMTLNPDVTLDDTLKDSISWSVSGWTTTITPKESNKLEATFKPGSSGDYVVTASCGSSQRLIRVKVAAPKIHGVTFNGNITINKDTGGNYSGVAWKDDDLDGGSDLTNANADSSKKYHPIAYRSTSTMSATAVFKPNCLKSNPANDKDFITAYDVEAAVKKVRFTPYSFWSWGNDWSTPVTLSMGGTSVTAANALSSSAKVGYDGSFELAWEVGFGEAGTADGSLSWERSYSEHELHLTFNAATSSYETVFHISCTNADGKTSESQIVSSIWSGFSGRNMKRKGSTITLTYYGSAALGGGYNLGAQGTAQILRLNSGRCGDWSKFFIDVVGAQGISAAEITVQPILSDGILVKNWIFPTAEDIPGNSYPYYMNNVVRGTGIPGQGLATPGAAWFNNHALAQYGTTVFDPSYGVTYIAGSTFKHAFETAALDGYTTTYGGYPVAGLIHVDDLR